MTVARGEERRTGKDENKTRQEKRVKPDRRG